MACYPSAFYTFFFKNITTLFSKVLWIKLYNFSFDWKKLTQILDEKNH